MARRSRLHRNDRGDIGRRRRIFGTKHFFQMLNHHSDLRDRIRSISGVISDRCVYANVGSCIVPIRHVPHDMLIERIIVVEPSHGITIIHNHLTEHQTSPSKEYRRSLPSQPIPIPVRNPGIDDTSW